jgi:hypothetical protein
MKKTGLSQEKETNGNPTVIVYAKTENWQIKN